MLYIQQQKTILKRKTMKQTSKKQSAPKVFTKVYNSVNQFWRALEQDNEQTKYTEKCSHTGSESFTGTKDYQSASDLLLYGNRADADEVLKCVAAIKRAVGKQSARQRVAAGVVGYAPIVPNYLAGVPRAMITSTSTPRKDKVINLVYNLTAPFWVTTETLRKAVINIAGAIVALEAGGARVNLWVQFAATGSYPNKTSKISCCIKVKSAGQPLDALKMVYPIGHPSMLRRHLFRWLEVTPDLPKGFEGSDYGCATSCTEGAELLKDCGFKYDRIFDYKSASENDYKALAKMIDTGVFTY